MAKVYRAYRHTWWHWKVARFTVIYDRQAEESTENYKLTLDDIRATFAHIDKLRAKGIIPPLKRYVEMDYVRKDKRGEYYIASDEQLEQVLTMQSRLSIDSDGNLVKNGQIIKYGYLASFDDKL